MVKRSWFHLITPMDMRQAMLTLRGSNKTTVKERLPDKPHSSDLQTALRGSSKVLYNSWVHLMTFVCIPKP